MEPLSLTRPKVLCELAGATLLDHVVRAVRKAGVLEVAVVVGANGEQVEAHLAKSADGPFAIVRQERPRGTGDALRAARRHLEGGALVVNGDVLAHASDIERVATAQARDAQVTVLTAEVADASRYGLVDADPAPEGLSRVRGLVEKPKGAGAGRVNAGVYRLGPEVADELDRLEESPRGEYELTSALQPFIAAGRAVAVAARHPWSEVSRPWDLLRAQERLMASLEMRAHGTVEPGATLQGPVLVSAGAIVKSGAYIEGPVFIGPDCRIGPNCYIRGSTHIGAGCHVGAGTEVKNSILFANSNAPHLNYVGDTVMGSQVNLGAGTKVANLRLDEREVAVVVGGERLGTGLRKFGAVLGDGVKTGINASINAGTVIGPGAFVGPGARASGAIEAGARVM
jgi:bifunctional UDP-N-acetylglucosamine pyrophosphorylase/glucosamine-1-phosphate N-acetyltransferase